MEIDYKINQIIELLRKELQYWIESFIKMLPNLVVAIVVSLIFWYLAKVVRALSEKLINRFSDNDTVTRLLGSINFFAVLITGIFVALGILKLDKTVTSLLAGAGVIGLVLGFAFQELSANFISGVFIAFRKPFRVNDVIKSGEYLGVVQRINLRATIIRTFYGQDIYIPNKILLTEALVNYTNDPRRLIELGVGVAYDSDLQEVEDTILEALTELEACAYPNETKVYYREFGDSSINLIVRMWINFPGNENIYKVAHHAIKQIKSAFDEKSIVIPFPIRTIEMSDKNILNSNSSESQTPAD